MPSGNTLTSDASGLGSTPGQGSSAEDSSFHPSGVGKLSTSIAGEEQRVLRCSRFCVYGSLWLNRTSVLSGSMRHRDELLAPDLSCLCANLLLIYLLHRATIPVHFGFGCWNDVSWWCELTTRGAIISRIYCEWSFRSCFVNINIANQLSSSSNTYNHKNFYFSSMWTDPVNNQASRLSSECCKCLTTASDLTLPISWVEKMRYLYRNRHRPNLFMNIQMLSQPWW